MNVNPQVSIFQESLGDGNIRKQEELDRVIAEHPELSKTYVWMSACVPEMRKVYEDEWLNVKKYLDNDFWDKFSTIDQEFVSRSWEFHLAVALTRHKMPLKEKNWEEGPDFCIQLENGKIIWIEAVACTLGDEDPVEPRPNLKPGVVHVTGGNIEDSHRPRALRITNAIATKFEKYNGYIKKGIVSKSDCIIIAINGQPISHYSDPGMLFKYAVFGQGPDILVRVDGGEKLQGGYYKPVSTITKYAKGKEEEIPPHFMEMEEFSIISSVIYCGNFVSSAFHNGYEIGDDFWFGYHTNPINPVPERLFKFGRGVRKESISGTIEDIDQSNKLDE